MAQYERSIVPFGHPDQGGPRPHVVRVTNYSKAGIPVMALPRINVWISLVPS